MEEQELFNGTEENNIQDSHRFTFSSAGVLGSLYIRWINFKALLSTLYVTITGVQAITGLKTFTQPVSIPAPTLGVHAVNLDTLAQYSKKEEYEFDNGDLTNQVYELFHDLGIQYPSSITVYNDQGIELGDNEYKYTAASVDVGLVKIYETNITGTWRIIIRS